MPDEVVRAADQIELVDITPEALRRRLSHGNVYAPERIDAALSNYFRRGNLTALRELALLWLADQVDAALAKYRADNHISDTWEARERVVVAVTGGAGVGDAGAQSVSHRVEVQRRTDGGARRARRRPVGSVGARRWASVRELAASLGATLHTVVGDDVPCGAAGFRPRDERHPAGARHVAAVPVGPHLRRGHRRRDGAAVRQDRRAHGDPRARPSRAGRGRRHRPRQRHLASWLAAVVVPSAICALTVLVLDRVPRHRRRERAVLRRRAGRRAARRRRAGRTVGGAVGPAAELLPRRAALHVHHRRTRQRDHHRRAAGGRGRGGRPGRRRGQAAPGRPGGRPRKPNCWRCSPGRCCAAPT